MDLLPELRWTAAALPATELTLVAVFSPEDQTVRASGVAVPEDSEPPAAAIGRLLETLMDRLVALDPETADREMNPRPVEPRPGASQPVADALAAYAAGDVAALDALDVTQPGTAFRQRAWRELRGIAPSTVTTRRPRSISVLRSFVLRSSRSMSTATTIENRPARASSNISAQRVPARRFFVADTALSS